jgi:hypothetical protein
MRAYRLLVFDDLSPTPQVWDAEMSGDARVAEFCRERVASSDHLRSIEIWAGPTRLGRIAAARHAA